MKIFHFTLRALGFTCIAFLMSSASCELFNKIDTITFQTVLEHSFAIEEGAVNTNGKHYASKPEDEILDASAVNKDFAEHADLIESITVNKLEYVLSGYSSSCLNPVGFSNGTLTFSDPDGGGNVLSKPVSHANLQAAQGTTFSLPLTQKEADDMANLLKNKKKVRFHTEGDLSCTPLYLTVKARLDCNITAKIL